MVVEFCKTYLAVGAGGFACILVGYMTVKLINFVMGLIKGVLSDILKIQKSIVVSLDNHDTNATRRDEKIILSIDNLLEFQNGSNPKLKEHDRRFEEIEKRLDK